MLVSKLQDIYEVDEQDFCMEPAEYEAMRRAFVRGEDVAVISVEVDNGRADHNYYNVVLECGTVLNALSADHLVGIANWK